MNSSREFLLGCIHLAEKEANLTHLIAAHLCTAGILNPIVTTNFDDLALAAFWHLPWIRTDDEPHVIYDPEGAVLSNPRIAEGVPIILKAHGHHTTYALGYLDRQIAHAAPYVRALMANLPRSTHGYIVAGYSGTWDDGVMKALSDTDLTQNKTIYWLYRGKTEPKGPLIDRVCRNADVRFVQIPGSDQAFLELWAAVPEDDGDGENISSAFSIGRHLGVEHLISCRSGWQPHTRRWPRTGYDWFNPSLINEDGSWRCQDQMRLDELRKELLPILERIEEVDRKYMKYACVLRGKLPSRVLKELDEAEVKLEELANRVPVAVPWTRRNRTLLRLGLSTGTDLQLATLLLSAFSSYSARQLPL